MARVLIAAGASGGHVYPALATAEVLRARGHDVSFAGGDRLEATIVPQAGFEFRPLPVRRPPSVRRELITPRGIRSLASMAVASLRARRLIRDVQPDVVLGMGGFASVPVSLAAGRSKVPLVLHEQNAHLSLAQRLSLRRADVVALGLPVEEGVRHDRVEIVGNPVRSSLVELAGLAPDERARARLAGRQALELDPGATTLLVFGGSLGSGPLNDVVPTIPLPGDVQVLHLTGRDRDEPVREAWSARPGVRCRVVGYLDRMQDAYAAADLVVSRSGAITVAELSVSGIAAVLVPLLTLARGDQEANARVLERAGAARVVMQSDPRFAGRLGSEVADLLADEQTRRSMGLAARSVGRPDAAERLADLVASAART